MQAGVHHADAARAVWAVMAVPGTVPASDAPGQDRRWLLRLMCATGSPPPPALAHVHELQLMLFRPLTARLSSPGDPRRDPAVQRLRDLSTRIIARAENAEERRGKVRHRALPDAQAHLRVWQGIRGSVQAQVAQGWAP